MKEEFPYGRQSIGSIINNPIQLEARLEPGSRLDDVQQQQQQLLLQRHLPELDDSNLNDCMTTTTKLLAETRAGTRLENSRQLLVITTFALKQSPGSSTDKTWAFISNPIILDSV